MAGSYCYLGLCAIAAAVAWMPQSDRRTDAAGFAGWPERLVGYELREPHALTAVEERFAAAFDGRLGRFGDGRRQFVVRWVAGPTRGLHPARDCYRAAGYGIEPLTPEVDANGRVWGRFQAVNDDERLQVRECVWNDKGKSWSDVSAWYWAAVFGADGPFWALTVVEADTPE